MSEPAPEVARGAKLLHLYRRGVGGERENAGRLLAAHLRAHDLTLYDLDPSLPVSQELGAVDAWRESAALVARLGTPHEDEALSKLVDATDLDEGEARRVLSLLDLDKLARSRAEGWAYTSGLPAEDLGRAAAEVTPEEVLAASGSIAERLRAASVARLWKRTHPTRRLRAEDPLARELVRGLVEGLTNREALLTSEGVEAELNVEELARARALIAQHLSSLTAEALRRARELARTFSRETPS